MALSTELYERFMNVDPATLGHHIGGMVTDSRRIEEMDFPVFATGVSVVTTAILGVSGKVDIPIQCCGAAVHPGDIIFGDADGVVVIPPDNYEEALMKAEKTVAREDMIRQRYLAGGSNIVNIEALYEGKPLEYINQLKKR